MSDHPEFEQPVEEVVEIVDGLPVLAEVRAVERPASAPLPAMHAAAAAATGFVAGAATFALLRRHGTRKLSRDLQAAQAAHDLVRRPLDAWPVGSTRTYLVNVRLIDRSWD